MVNSRKLKQGDESPQSHKTILDGAFKNNKAESIFSGFSDFLDSLFKFKKKSVSLIIPAYNEEPRISKVIKTAQKIKKIDEIIVVDDGSKDKTGKVAAALGVKVIKHHKNLGKGESIKTGIAHSKKDILLFLDADLLNIDEKKINALINPILKDKADFTKAAFGLARGRVTEFAIKPMMKVLYPNEKFKQPISGQFAGRKKFFKDIDIEPRWGIDISILLDAIKKGERVVEVDIGEIKHKARASDEKAEMSQQVMETMLKKVGFLCNKHRIIFFSDKTLFSPIFSKKVEVFLDMLKNKKIKIVILTKRKVKPKFQNYFSEIKKIKGDESSRKILSIAKKVCKKYECDLEDSVLVSNISNFDSLAKKIKLSYCFSNSPKKIQDQSELISSLAEVLMYLK